MNTIMNFIIDNWYVFVLIIAAIVVAAYVIYNFYKKPTSEKFKKVQEWLIIACEVAEKELGEGTGQIKLQYVYTLFTTKFPWISKILSFTTFSILCEKALVEFKKLLINNKELQAKVYGKELDDAEIEKLNKQIEDAEK